MGVANFLDKIETGLRKIVSGYFNDLGKGVVPFKGEEFHLAPDVQSAMERKGYAFERSFGTVVSICATKDGNPVGCAKTMKQYNDDLRDCTRKAGSTLTAKL